MQLSVRPKNLIRSFLEMRYPAQTAHHLKRTDLLRHGLRGEDCRQPVRELASSTTKQAQPNQAINQRSRTNILIFISVDTLESACGRLLGAIPISDLGKRSCRILDYIILLSLLMCRVQRV